MKDKDGKVDTIMSLIEDVTERKLMEESSLRLASIVGSSRDAIVSLSLDNLITSWNHSAKILYGYSSEEVIGKPYSILSNSENTDEFAKTIERLKVGEKLDRIEREHVRKNGDQIFVSISLSPILDVKGNLIGISSNEHNISSQKKVEIILKQAAHRRKSKWLEKIKGELAVTLIMALALLLLSIYFNFPKKISQAIGNPDNSIIDDVIIILAPLFVLVIILSISMFRDEYKGGKEIQDALATLTNELEMRVQERTSELSKSNEGLLDEIIERKKAEKNLKQSEFRLKEAQTLAHVGNWELNFETGTAIWSDEACRIYGLSPTECKQSFESWLSFIHPDDVESVMATSVEAEKTLKDSIYVHRIITKDGTVRHIYTESKFEIDKYGKPVGIYGIFHDVTEREIAEKEREKIIADVVQRNKDLEQFSYIVSHNLRAPVANIQGLTEMLRTAEMDEKEEEEIIYLLSGAVIKLNNVIIDLNTILQTKKNLSEQSEGVSFSHILRNIRISISELIKEQGVEIIADFSRVDKMVTIKSYLYSIMYNLISNSIKYRQPDIPAVIKIESLIEANKIVLLFKDNGLGIDLKNKSEQVFGLYKRFHKHVEGKGMGLYMVKTQVETLGGRITLQSEVNKGTEFRIEFEDQVEEKMKKSIDTILTTS